jgi:hypothetical protein
VSNVCGSIDGSDAPSTDRIKYRWSRKNSGALFGYAHLPLSVGRRDKNHCKKGRTLSLVQNYVATGAAPVPDQVRYFSSKVESSLGILDNAYSM